MPGSAFRIFSQSGLPTLQSSLTDLRSFSELEREVLLRRWRLFAPVVFVLFAVSEVAAHLTPEFPKSPIITAIMLSLMAGVYGLARLRPSRAVIGWTSVVVSMISAGYVATAAAETGRFHSMQVLAMAVLFAVIPGIFSITLVESITSFAGSIVTWVLVCRFWKVEGPVDYSGLATGLTYLTFIGMVTVLTLNSNRRLRFREFMARREVERIHRFAVEEVLCRHLPPIYVERVLSGEHPLDSPPERRLITVIFADIVAFTPLTEALAPEALGQLMARFYDVTATAAFENGATIDKFIGDAVMAILGAPEAMSADQQARRAVKVARAWHRVVADLAPGGPEQALSLRIGIHQDTVAVGSFGGKLRSDYTVLGRGVNIASRLEKRCRPGEILVSSTVYSLLNPTEFPAHDLGPLDLKGLPHPIRCFQLRGDGLP